MGLLVSGICKLATLRLCRGTSVALSAWLPASMAAMQCLLVRLLLLLMTSSQMPFVSDQLCKSVALACICLQDPAGTHM